MMPEPVWWSGARLLAALTPERALEGIRRRVAQPGRGQSVRWHYAGEGTEALVMLGDDAVTGLALQKTLFVRPGLPGVVAVSSLQDGRPLLFLDGAVFTGIRTAAIAAYAVSQLASSRRRQTVLGAGFEAYFHARAVGQLGGLEELSLWNRTPERAERLRQRLVSDPMLHGVAITAVSDLDGAVRDRDVIITVTGSPTPLVRRVGPRTLVVAMGSYRPTDREVAGDVLADALLVADCPWAWDEAGEFVLARQEGAVVAPPRILWDPNFEPVGRPVVMKSIGAAFYDVAVAATLMADPMTSGGR